MIPDLGKYAVYVLGSYGVSLLLILVLVAQSVLRARRVRTELERVEKRVRRDGA